MFIAVITYNNVLCDPPDYISALDDHCQASMLNIDVVSYGTINEIFSAEGDPWHSPQGYRDKHPWGGGALYGMAAIIFDITMENDGSLSHMEWILEKMVERCKISSVPFAFLVNREDGHRTNSESNYIRLTDDVDLLYGQWNFPQLPLQQLLD